MFWMRGTLQKRMTDTDALGNEIESDPVMIDHALCRLAPWTEDLIDIQQRTVTEDEQVAIIRCGYEVLEQSDSIQIGAATYDIVRRIKLPRGMCAAILKVYKP